MTLTKPPLAPVSAGNPITAQAWNEILSALGALFDEVIGLGGVAVDVVLNGGAITDAVVVAVPATGAPVAAVPPRGTGTAFTLPHLVAGTTWTLHVAAPGFDALQQPITLPPTGVIAITLTANTKAMPDLLGQTAQAAMTRLTTDGIQLGAIYDTDGTEVSKSAFPANRNGTRVLFHFPTPTMPVHAATANVRLVLAAPPTQMVTVPDVRGKTLAAAQAQLIAAGLRVTVKNQ